MQSSSFHEATNPRERCDLLPLHHGRQAGLFPTGTGAQSLLSTWRMHLVSFCLDSPAPFPHTDSLRPPQHSPRGWCGRALLAHGGQGRRKHPCCPRNRPRGSTAGQGLGLPFPEALEGMEESWERQACAWSPLTGCWHVQSRNLLTVPLLGPMKDCLGLWETRRKCAAPVLAARVPCGLKRV